METRGRRSAARRIQNWWRSFLRHVDPLTLGPVRASRLWAGGTLFNLPELREYVQHTGDTLHPITRQPFSSRVLRRLGVHALSEARTAHEARQRNEGLREYLESETNEHVEAIIRDVMSNDAVALVILRFIRERLPTLAAALTDLRRVRSTNVEQVLQRAIQLLHAQEVPPERFALFFLAHSFFRDYLRLSQSGN